MLLVSVIIYLLLSVGGLVLVKLGSNSISLLLSNGVFNFTMSIKAILGFVFYIGSFIIYTFYIIRKFNLSYIFPILTGITQILVIIAGILIFKEKINVYGYVGISFIILGIVLMNIK